MEGAWYGWRLGVGGDWRRRRRRIALSSEYWGAGRRAEGGWRWEGRDWRQGEGMVKEEEEEEEDT